MNTRLERLIEFIIGCGLLLSAMLALRLQRVSVSGSLSGLSPANVAASCEDRQAQAAELLGR